MKQSKIMIICISLLLTMLGLLIFAGAIYDAEKKFTIDTFFFEPNSRSAQRILPPLSAEDIPDKNLREWLIKRFVYEYFYVVPNAQNARNRLETKDADGKLTALYRLSRPSVFKNWVNSEGPQIVAMAEKKMLRTVQVLPDIIEDESGNLVVKYILRTWEKPNDVLAKPVIQSGVLYMNVTREPISIIQTDEATQLLKDGADPVSAFKFKVISIEQQ